MDSGLIWWRCLLLDLVDALAAFGEETEEPMPGHGRRVADLALALADAAAGDSGIEEPLLTEGERDSIRIAALLHALVDGGHLHGEHQAGRLSNEAMAAVEYRLRWIQETCRHRAMTRSILDGGGFYPPPDPSGAEGMDYALRASEIEGILEFLCEMNDRGPATEAERERLGAIARRTLETGEGPPVPYLNETEHVLLAAPPGSRRTSRKERCRDRAENLLSRLSAVDWPRELRSVPDLLEALFFGADHEALLPARLLEVAEHWDHLMHRGGPEGTGLPADQVLTRLRREAEAGRLDGRVVSVLAHSGLLPGPPPPPEPPDTEAVEREPSIVH